MHEDLEKIQSLWQSMHRSDQLQRARLVLVEQQLSTKEASAAADTARQEAEAVVIEIRSEERQIMRKLGAYRKRIDNTRRMIRDGKAADYRLAEQQLRSCIEIADELETKALETMMARDEAEQVAAHKREAAASAERARAEAVRAHKERIPVIDRELEILDLASPALQAEVPRAYRSAIKTLRARRRSVVAELRDGACSVCHVTPSPQSVLEINGHRRVHACSNCYRFLIPVAPPASPSDLAGETSRE